MDNRIAKYLEMARSNAIIVDSFVKADSIVNNPKYKEIACSISGGSDSDIMLDIVHKVDFGKKVKYVWFNTGVEYQATKDHLVYLEKKYNIEIEKERAIKPIPLSCREYGQPFLNKMVSGTIEMAQKNGFQWEDEPYEILIEKYPKIKSVIKWWTNSYCWDEFKTSMFDINYNKWLKEFLIQNPPTFRISSKCCKYAKKNVAKKYREQHKVDLEIMGVRKAEGGVRNKSYKNCFTDGQQSFYRPIFWYKDADKSEYERIFEIVHSACYSEYGMQRTGCVGCPFIRDLDEHLEILKEHEPNLCTAACNIFKDSYEYTRAYRRFYKEMEQKEKDIEGQMTIEDYLKE